MSNFTISFNAVFPLFVLVMLGMFLKRVKLLSESTTAQLNKILFTVLIPVLLFGNLYHADAVSVFRPKLMIYSICGVLLFWGVTAVIACFSIKDPKARGAFIQGSCRSNFILFGLPMVGNLVSADSIVVVSFVAAFTVPLYNLLSVVTLEFLRHEKISFGKVMISLATNPLIIGSLIGLLFLLTGIKLPAAFNSVLDTLGSMASPIGLLVMGSALMLDKIKGKKGILSIAILLKLVIIPLIGISAAILIGFRGIDLLTITALFAAPSAVSAYPISVEMESDSDLTCQIIVFTTALSMLTNFLLIFAIAEIGFIG